MTVNAETLAEFSHRDPDLIYLNSGTLSITPASVTEAAASYRQGFERNPTQGLHAAWGMLWKVQCRLAEFLGASPHDLFLRSNVTQALNEFLLGMPLPSGSEVLIGDREYGAVHNALALRARRSGLKLRVIPTPRDGASLARHLTDRTSLVVLSHVLTGTGECLPIEDLARETRARGVLFCVDGAHAPGALPIDFKRLGDVDFYGGNLHKWMMGPKGTAFGWAPRRVLERIEPLQAGWTTFEITPGFTEFGDGDAVAGRMLLMGSLDFAPLFALGALLDFWKAAGPGEIRAAVVARGIHLRRKVQSRLGWELLSPVEGGGPLHTFRLPPELKRPGFGLMHELLHQHRLQVGLSPVHGEMQLRLSPHIYNSNDEIDRGVEILASVLRVL